jgi:hypothetical protein
VPLPVLIEDTISPVDPLALLGAFEVDSSPIKVPKRVNCFLGALNVAWISIRASVPPQIAVSADYIERAFRQQ